jgi:transglutaminase-like putative cysteine protease
MQVNVGCEFTYRAEVPTHAVIQVEPRLENGVAVLDERWTNVPRVGMTRYVDSFGNVCRRTTIVPGDSSLRYDATLEVPEAVDPERLDAVELAPRDLPDDVLVFTLPSRYCPSQELADDAWRLFGSLPPGWGRVQAICDWVHDEVAFGYLDTSPLATAADVFKSRAGVCRDFAHLAVTFCRALNIPARYVFGYLPDIGVPPAEPMDFAAWIEVFLDGRWWTFDPRNNQPRIGRALIGRGRDALDVAMVSTYGGPRLLSMVVWASEIEAVGTAQ